MDIEKIFEVESDDMAFKSVGDAVAEARRAQSQRLSDNVQAVLSALGKMKSEIEGKYDDVAIQLEQRIASIRDGRDGAPGRDGTAGRDGAPGRPGRDGKDGRNGVDGRDGVDGQDGVSVTNAYLDFDNSLVIELSNGRQINVGEVLPPDLSDRLKVIINQGASGGGGGGASLPDQTGHAGQFLTTDGSTASWGTPAGSGDVVGPSSATDNAVARFDTTTGKLIQNSVVTVSDTGAVAGVTSITTPDYIDLDTTASPASAVGRVAWDDGDGTMTIGLKGGNVNLQVGQENVVLSYNGTGSTLTIGKIVAVVGAQGQRPSIALADADSESLSAATLGVVTESIANGAEGFVTTFGVIRGFDTSAFTAGDPVYLSQTAGSFTATRPAAPAHTVFMGWVVKSHASSGEVFLNINNGWELDELHNVKITSPTAGDLLIYDQTAGYWENAKLTAGSNITITNADGSITIASTGGGGSGDGGAYAWFLS